MRYIMSIVFALCMLFTGSAVVSADIQQGGQCQGAAELTQMSRGQVTESFERALAGLRAQGNPEVARELDGHLNDVAFAYQVKDSPDKASILIIPFSSDEGYVVSSVASDPQIAVMRWSGDEVKALSDLKPVVGNRIGDRTIKPKAAHWPDCGPGTVPTCMKYNMSCLKRLAPSWVGHLCDLVPGVGPKIACYVTMMYAKAQDCCTLYGCRPDQG